MSRTASPRASFLIPLAIATYGCSVSEHLDRSDEQPVAEAQPAVSDVAAPRPTAPSRIVWESTGSTETHVRNGLGECGVEARSLARAAGVTDVSSCVVDHFAHGVDKLALVRLDYGPVMDCPSGCFQDSVGGVVRGDAATVAWLPAAGPGTAYGYVRGVPQTKLDESLIRHANGSYYDWYDAEEQFWCGNDIVPQLVSQGDELWWEWSLGHHPRCFASLGGPGHPARGVEVELSGVVRAYIRSADPARQGHTDYSEAAVRVTSETP